VVERIPALLVRAGSRVCGLPIASVNETMRPLPVEPIRGAPPMVLGLAIVRGAPVPVVDLATLVGAGSDERHPVTRFVSLRSGSRTVALAVESVMGVRELDGAGLQQPAPLLGTSVVEVVARVGALDRELLLVLDAARTLSEGMWQSLEQGPGP
jgi:purine-binding chemotaxis protein CheW